MQLTAELDGKSHQINFHREDTTVTAEIDGRRYEVSVRRLDQDVYLLMADGHTYECSIDTIRTRMHSVVVQLGRDAYAITLVDPKRLRSGVDSTLHTDGGTAEISSPMAGKVVRILVEQGAHLKAGDGIVVVEAMKMQNELKSPCDGIVTGLSVVAGATVNAGEVLAIVEADSV